MLKKLHCSRKHPIFWMSVFFRQNRKIVQFNSKNDFRLNADILFRNFVHENIRFFGCRYFSQKNVQFKEADNLHRPIIFYFNLITQREIFLLRNIRYGMATICVDF